MSIPLVLSFTLSPSVVGSLNGNVTFRRKKEKTRKRSEKSGFLAFFPSVVSSLPLSTAFLPYHSPYPVVLSLLSRLIIRPSSRVITRRLQIIKGLDSDFFFRKSDRHLALRLRDSRGESSLKSAREVGKAGQVLDWSCSRAQIGFINEELINREIYFTKY